MLWVFEFYFCKVSLVADIDVVRGYGCGHVAVDMRTTIAF